MLICDPAMLTRSRAVAAHLAAVVVVPDPSVTVIKHLVATLPWLMGGQRERK